MDNRSIPNPESKMLAQAVVGGAGLGLPPDISVPPGMGAVLLLVPVNQIIGKSMPDIQNDLGLPWHAGNGDGVWFEELQSSK